MSESEKLPEKVGMVCIIDDDSTYTYLIKRILKSQGLCEQIESYMNGREAIDQLLMENSGQESFPDVILLDLNMPILDGWGFLEEVNRSGDSFPRETLIFVVTSSVSQRDITRANNMDRVAGYITKPMTIQKLKNLFIEISKRDGVTGV